MSPLFFSLSTLCFYFLFLGVLTFTHVKHTKYWGLNPGLTYHWDTSPSLPPDSPFPTPPFEHLSQWSMQWHLLECLYSIWVENSMKLGILSAFFKLRTEQAAWCLAHKGFPWKPAKWKDPPLKLLLHRQRRLQDRPGLTSWAEASQPTKLKGGLCNGSSHGTLCQLCGTFQRICPGQIPDLGEVFSVAALRNLLFSL